MRAPGPWPCGIHVIKYRGNADPDPSVYKTILVQRASQSHVPPHISLIFPCGGFVPVCSQTDKSAKVFAPAVLRMWRLSYAKVCPSRRRRDVADQYRVRCDLKDLPADTAVPHPACSNCKERGIRCVYVHCSRSLPYVFTLRQRRVCRRKGSQIAPSGPTTATSRVS